MKKILPNKMMMIVLVLVLPEVVVDESYFYYWKKKIKDEKTKKIEAAVKFKYNIDRIKKIEIREKII